MIDFFKRLNISNIALILVFLTALYFAFKCSYLQVINANLKTDHIKQLKEIDQTNLKELIKNQKLNDALSAELDAVKQNLELKKQELEQSRNEAIKSDGDFFNGIGADSLRHYKRALGYSD